MSISLTNAHPLPGSTWPAVSQASRPCARKRKRSPRSFSPSKDHGIFNRNTRCSPTSHQFFERISKVASTVAKGESGAPPMASRLSQLIRPGLTPKGLHWARFLLEELPSSVASMEWETRLERSKDATWSGTCILPLAAWRRHWSCRITMITPARWS